MPRGLCPQTLDEGFQAHHAQILSAAGTHGNLPVFLFAVTDHQQVRHPLQSMLADFIADFLITQILCRPEAFLDQRLLDGLYVIGL